MNKKIVLILIGAVLVIGGGIATTMSRPSATSDASMSSATSSQGNQSGQTSSATDKVTIKDYEFSPKTTQVKVGTTITWTNQDSVQHTVTTDPGKDGPHSETLKQGDTYSYTFKTAGSFAYDCEIHPSMHGTVTVTE